MLLVSVGAIVAAVVTAAAATWLVNPERTNEIACAGEFIKPAASCDPVADCAAELDRMGIEHGELAAYVNPLGGIAVREVDDVPSGWTPIGETVTQDLALIRLDEDLNDYVDGLASGCFTVEEATQVATEAIARYGLTGIPVTVRHPTSGPDRCALGSVMGDGAEVGILMDVGPTRGESKPQERHHGPSSRQQHQPPSTTIASHSTMPPKRSAKSRATQANRWWSCPRSHPRNGVHRTQRGDRRRPQGDSQRPHQLTSPSFPSAPAAPPGRPNGQNDVRVARAPPTNGMPVSAGCWGARQAIWGRSPLLRTFQNGKPGRPAPAGGHHPPHLIGAAERMVARPTAWQHRLGTTHLGWSPARG